jgi:mannose-6-phosphate isomerase-like protein (cupin superfamily)
MTGGEPGSKEVDPRMTSEAPCTTPLEISDSTHVEAAAFPGLTRIDLGRVAAAVTQAYKNTVLVAVNDHCLRIAVMQGDFPWHRHPHSDECFVTLEGCLEIDLADGQTFRLAPGEAFAVPAGVVHRTRSSGRSVNLCFEHRAAYTDVELVDGTTAQT